MFSLGSILFMCFIKVLKLPRRYGYEIAAMTVCVRVSETHQVFSSEKLLFLFICFSFTPFFSSSSSSSFVPSFDGEQQ